MNSVVTLIIYKTKVFLIAIILLVSSTNLLSQNYYFEYFSTKDGLSQSQIFDIIQSKDGFLWLSTNGGGVNKFDGKYFTALTQKDGLANNVVFSLFQDSHDRIWMGSAEGLSKYENGIFTNYTKAEGLTNNTVFCFAEMKDGRILIGTAEGITIFQSDSLRTYLPNTDLNKYSARDMIVDGDNLWIGSTKGLIKVSNNEFHLYSDLARKEVGEIYTIKKVGVDSILCGTYEHGAWLFTNDNFTPFLREMGKKSIHDIMIDDSDNYWFGLDSEGMVQYDGKNLVTIDKRNGLFNNSIYKIFQDSEKNIWFTSLEGGLYKFHSDSFTYYNQSHGLCSDIVYKVYTDSRNRILIGTAKGCVSILDKEKFSDLNLRTRNSGDIFSILEDKNGTFWFGTKTGIIHSTKYYSKKYNSSNGLKSDIVFALLETKNGDIWAGTYGGGITVIRNNSIIKNYDTKTGLKSHYIFALYQDTHDNIWIGTYHGLSKWDGQKFTNYSTADGLGANMITSISAREKDEIWVGTYGGGISVVNFRQDSDSISVSLVNTDKGLCDDAVITIVPDHENNFFIGTNKGISKISFTENKKTPVKIENYSEDNGLKNIEVNQNGSCIDRDGNVWFGTNEGIIKFSPAHVKFNNAEPYINITNIKLYLEDYKYTNKSDIIFEPDENYITFEYTGICLTNPDKIKYTYQLEGLDEKWSPVTKENYITYSNLPPGDYVFKVKACNNEGIWNTKPAQLMFTIKTPIYKAWYFYLTTGLLIILLTLFLYRRRIERAEKKQQELEEIIDKKISAEKILKKAKEKAEKSDILKSEFLAQMSHEIRTPISYILSFTALLKEHLEGNIPEELDVCFKSIDKGSQRLIKTIDSILNMSQITTGNYDAFIQKLDLYVDILSHLYHEFKSSAEHKNLELTIVNNSDNCTIAADEYTVTQLFANLIENAIKYTEHGFVKILIENHDKKIEVTISDSGIGISEENIQAIFNPFTQEQAGYTRQYEGIGLGLSLVKKYCELNDAAINVTSKKGVGTSFKIIFEKFGI